MLNYVPTFATCSEWHNFINCSLNGKASKIKINECVKSIFVDSNFFLYLRTTKSMAILVA